MKLTGRSRPRGVKGWLQGVVKRLASKVRPQKIILFGSYAYGKPHKNSDVDLFVIVDHPADRDKRYELVDKAIGEHRWPLDLFVRGPGEVESRLRMGDSFLRDILSHGKVLYEP